MASSQTSSKATWRSTPRVGPLRSASKTRLTQVSINTLAKRAEQCFRQGAYDECLALMHLVCERRSSPADFRLLAAAAHKSQDEDTAVAAYEQCLSAFANDVNVLVNLGELYLARLRYAQAAKLLQHALELDPQAHHPAGVRARMLIMKTKATLA